MSNDRIPRIADGIIFKRVGEELVLLDFDRGVYFGLDAVGASIWQLIAEGRSVEAIIDALVEEYETTRDELERDVSALLEELESNGLIR